MKTRLFTLAALTTAAALLAGCASAPRGPLKLTVLDTVDGRWAIRERSTDGELWFALVPADRDGLVRAVTELGAAPV